MRGKFGYINDGSNPAWFLAFRILMMGVAYERINNNEQENTLTGCRKEKTEDTSNPFKPSWGSP